MSDRMVERDERGREIVYVSGKDLPTVYEWSKHGSRSPSSVLLRFTDVSR